MAVLTTDTSLQFVGCKSKATAGIMAVSALWRIRKFAPSSGEEASRAQPVLFLEFQRVVSRRLMCAPVGNTGG